MALAGLQELRAIGYLEEMAGVLGREVPEVLAGLRRVAEGWPVKPALLGIGHSSSLAMGGKVAMVEAGAVGAVVGVSKYRPGSLHEAMNYALGEFCRRRQVPYFSVNADALLAGKASVAIPEEVAALLGRRKVVGLPLIVDESIAFGSPTRLPGAPEVSVVNLTKAGELERVTVRPAAPETLEKTINNMGRNPGVWARLLKELERDVLAFFSYSWPGRGMASYEVLAAAKRVLEEEAAAGGRFVVMQRATVTPALPLIAGALPVGIEGAILAAEAGDPSPAALTAIAVLGGLDRTFVHRQLEREGGYLLRVDGTETTNWGRITAKIGSLEARVPTDRTGRIPPDESDRILQETMGWQAGPDGWRRHLRPIRVLEEMEGAPPEGGAPAAAAAAGGVALGAAPAVAGAPATPGVAATVAGSAEAGGAVAAVPAAPPPSANPVVARYFTGLLGRQREKLGGRLTYDLASKRWTLTGGRFNEATVEAIAAATGNRSAGEGLVSRLTLFVFAQPAIFASIADLLLEGKIPIHRQQKFGPLTRPLQVNDPFTLVLEPRARSGTVLLNLTFQGEDGSPLVTGRTTLFFTDRFGEGGAQVVDLAPVGDLMFEEAVTGETIDRYAAASGDDNIVHVNAEAARGIGLRDRILHGMAVAQMAERALVHGVDPAEAQRVIGLEDMEAAFLGVVYPGDTLRFHRQGGVVQVINQRGEPVFTRRSITGK